MIWGSMDAGIRLTADEDVFERVLSNEGQRTEGAILSRNAPVSSVRLVFAAVFAREVDVAGAFVTRV